MKKEYDFSKAEKGKFYSPEKDINIPIYLDEKVIAFFNAVAIRKKTDVSKIVNKILKSEMSIYEEMGMSK